MKKVLLTGAAGFIGARIGELLLTRGYRVVGIDNMNNYYDVRLKRYRLNRLMAHSCFSFYGCDIEDQAVLSRIFNKHKFDAILNLAARAGVRYSIVDPSIYMSTNANGTLNLFEQCRKHGIKKFVLASSSSLYAGQKMPFKEDISVNRPISPYAASKKAAEEMAYVYHYLYGIDVTILRYFSVYGPAGRPDMSPFRFIKWIDEGKAVKLFGDGFQRRDFTYIDDIATGSVKALKKMGYKIINLGNHTPYNINQMIRFIEKSLGKKAKIERHDSQKVDMKATWADISKAKRILGWFPKVGLEEGIDRTVGWYLANKPWISKIKI